MGIANFSLQSFNARDREAVGSEKISNPKSTMGPHHMATQLFNVQHSQVMHISIFCTDGHALTLIPLLSLILQPVSFLTLPQSELLQVRLQ